MTFSVFQLRGAFLILIIPAVIKKMLSAGGWPLQRNASQGNDQGITFLECRWILQLYPFSLRAKLLATNFCSQLNRWLHLSCREHFLSSVKSSNYLWYLI
ncbi:hypothetical protein QN277_008625 [Acacia crassicarpa]|uniref:Uncharacterized protein n=1 Tax=Acacia crassicarpa TaxID=499986 RepID=A0AAE1M6U8_9FABA|nr:hypothetical protein QN277_008625 [Acacia crassicarpa]